MEELSLAYNQTLLGRRQHIIIVLVDKPAPGVLPPELEDYINSHTYIEAHNYADAVDTIQGKIRCAMPNVPLKHIKVGRQWSHSIILVL